MVSKMRLSLAGIMLAGLLLLIGGVQSDARAQEALPSAMATQISALLDIALSSGDTSALEESLAALAEANPDLAVAIANFATKQLPSSLPAGLPANFMEDLVTAITTSIVSGAPAAAGDIVAVVSANQPRFSGAVKSAVEATLVIAGFETAAGGGPAGPPAFGFLPSLPGRAAAAPTAENPATSSASPAGPPRG